MKPGGAQKNNGFRKPFLLPFAENPKGFLFSFTQHGRLSTKHQRILSQMQTIATATARTTFVTDEVVRHRSAH